MLKCRLFEQWVLKDSGVVTTPATTLSICQKEPSRQSLWNVVRLGCCVTPSLLFTSNVPRACLHKATTLKDCFLETSSPRPEKLEQQGMHFLKQLRKFKTQPKRALSPTSNDLPTSSEAAVSIWTHYLSPKLWFSLKNPCSSENQATN